MSLAQPPRLGPRRRPVRGVLSILVAALAWATTPDATAASRSEVAIPTTSPQTGVATSLVRLHAPMPAGTPPHPEACDWIQYLRFRSTDGPAAATDADAVTVLMPGLLEGATAFDPVARNAVREAARRGQAIEVWAIDRRANCLEDLTGLQLFERTGDVERSLAYYYGDEQIAGRTFASFSGGGHPVLAEIGIAQTVRDYHEVLARELPSQPWRERHVICGGHSLGGPLVEIFAGWDFDGDPSTTADAGYRQCAGFVAFDSILDLGLTAHRPSPSAGLQLLTAGLFQGASALGVGALRSGAVQRHVSVIGIGPETLSLVEALGNLATTQPDADATPLVARVPRTREVETYYHLAASPDLSRWLSSTDSLRDMRFTNAGLLGQLVDDNGAPAGLLRASIGYFDRAAPLRRNRLPEQVNLIPGLNIVLQRGRLMMPQRRSPQPLAGWVNYDALGSGPTRVGAGVTAPSSEVTDATTFARILHEGPTNLSEHWFPTRIVTDLALVASGGRTGDLRSIVHANPTRRKPRFAVMAGDGVFRRAGVRPQDPNVSLPGYDHLDVITAAERQNNGLPERSSQSLVDLIGQATGR